MMGGGNYLLASILLLAVGNALGADVIEGTYNVTQVCTTVPTNTKLGSISSCSDYYQCTSSGPVKSTCQSGYYYNYQTQQCAPQSEVSCYYGLDNPCAGMDGTTGWVPNLNNCQGWYYCNGTTLAGHGSCGAGQVFSGTKGSCVYGNPESCSSTSGSTGPTLNSMCEVVPPGIYFGSVTNCTTWYKCKSGSSTPSTGQCSTSAFIVENQACGYASAQGACDRIVSDSSSAGEACTTPVIKGDSSVCGNYFVCVNGIYETQQCATGDYYDTVSQTCKNRKAAKATEGCNRCQDANVDFVNAASPSDCSSYYYCYSNGARGTATPCKAVGSYFNEADQACAFSPDVATYAQSNGACYLATSGTTGSSDSTDSTGSTVSGATEATTTKPADTPTEAPTETPATADAGKKI